jgi:hypothetical protein
VSSPLDTRLDDLRAAYFDVPAGQPSAEQLTEAMPRLLTAVAEVLQESGRVCPVCTEYHRSESDVEHEDFAAILNGLGLGDHARPISRHAIVHREILPALRRLRARS